jgi:hypothetical protein
MRIPRSFPANQGQAGIHPNDPRTPRARAAGGAIEPWAEL